MSVSKKGNHLNESLSACTALKTSATGLVMQTAEAQIDVIPYSSDVIRIRIKGKNEPRHDHSYAVVQGPQTVKFKVSETKALIRLQTGTVKLVIKKDPVRFSFYTLIDELINADFLMVKLYRLNFICS